MYELKVLLYDTKIEFETVLIMSYDNNCAMQQKMIF
jgi:hypothetical protein